MTSQVKAITIASFVAEARGLIKQATPGPWTLWAMGGERHAIASLADIPNRREPLTSELDMETAALSPHRLGLALNALEALQELHKPIGTPGNRFCRDCQKLNDGMWPCPTIATVEAALQWGDDEGWLDR